MNAGTTDDLPLLRIEKPSRPIGRSMSGRTPAKLPPFPTRILLVDAAEVVRTGLRIVLESNPALRVVAGCSSLRDARRLARQHHVDLVIMERHFPAGNAFKTCRAMLSRMPHLSAVFLTDRWESNSMALAFEAGAKDCLVKSLDQQRLVAAVRRVAGVGDDHPARSISSADLRSSDWTFQSKPPSVSLSPRERQLVPLISEGLTNKEIASLLALADKTVKNYLSNLYRKLRLSRRVQVAALYAGHTGFLEKNSRSADQDPAAAVDRATSNPMRAGSSRGAARDQPRASSSMDGDGIRVTGLTRIS